MAIFIGYSGIVWNTVYRTLAYFTDQLSTMLGAAEVDSSAIALLSEGMLSTLLNATQAINADALATAWSEELTNLEGIQALPLVLDATTAQYFNARVGSYGSALPSLIALIPQPPFSAPSVITNGDSVIPATNLLDYFSIFDFETPPPGTPAINTILAQAQEMAVAWQNVANAISVLQGAQITQLYDVAVRESTAANFAASIIADFTSGQISFVPSSTEGIGSFIIGTTAIGGTADSGPWNSIAALPAMQCVGSIISSAPYIQANQQQSVIRNAMLTFAAEIQLLLLSLRQPILSQTSLTTVLVGETLLDVAARATGDFENWQAIAALNGLVPPYTGPNKLPGIAAWGTQIALPTPGQAPAAIGTIPSYSQNYLGVDLYFGPINGQMPAWTGDFQTIVGYRNLAWALGRRIQTTLGTFLYHSNYGSRIPPQVGNIQTNETAGHIAAFGKSALLADPRVALVTSARAQLQPGQIIEFSANVQPGGFQQSVPINEVLSPVP